MLELAGGSNDRLAVIELMLKWAQELQPEAVRYIEMRRRGDSTGHGFGMEFDGWRG